MYVRPPSVYLWVPLGENRDQTAEGTYTQSHTQLIQTQCAHRNIAEDWVLGSRLLALLSLLCVAINDQGGEDDNE